MKKFFLITVLICSVVSLTAQTKKFERYWILGLGNADQSMYDEAISFVRYKGSGMAPTIGLVKKS